MTIHEEPRGFVPRSELYKALAEVDRLRIELQELRSALSTDVTERAVWAFRSSLHLSRQEARTLTYVLSARTAFVLVPQAVEDLEMPQEKQFAVVVWKINQRAAEHGAPRLLLGKRGSPGGYTVPLAAREWLRTNVPEAFAKEAVR